MNNLYKRIVTMGMISFSALLAWLYCIIAHTDKTVYVICLSLLLVISLYALCNAFVKLRISKDEAMYRYISETIATTISSMVPDTDSAREAERIAKATYVQLRKANSGISSLTEANNTNAVRNIDNYTALSHSVKDAMTKAMSDTAKIVVKYNKQDNQNVMEVLREFTSNMQDISQSLDAINTRIDNMNVVAQKHPKTILEDSVMDDTLPDSFDIFPAEPTQDNASLFEEPAPMAFPDSGLEEATSVAEEPAIEEPADPGRQLTPDEIAALFSQTASPEEEAAIEEPSDPNRQLTPDEIAALFSQTASPEEEAAIEEPSDPDRQLTPDEIAALFNQSVEERTAKSDDDFDKANVPEAMDQTLIDALLNNLDNNTTVEDTSSEKIIPFPATEEAEVAVEAPAEPEDPNKQLSADEIAALFASMNSHV